MAVYSEQIRRLFLQLFNDAPSVSWATRPEMIRYWNWKEVGDVSQRLWSIQGVIER
jgi:hypothetical protein